MSMPLSDRQKNASRVSGALPPSRFHCAKLNTVVSMRVLQLEPDDAAMMEKLDAEHVNDLEGLNHA